MKIFVVMPYFNRQEQVNRTFETIAQSACKDVEIVIIDDASKDAVILPKNYKYPIHLITTPKERKFWTSCAVIPYNQGIIKSIDLGADIIVLQNPENFHVGDVLAHIEDNSRDGLYLTYACLSLPKGETNANLAKTCDWGTGCGLLGWYNHSKYRPCYMEFCSALTRKDMLSINGYDERFADGVACGDCDLLRRIKNLGLECRIIDEPFVVHQWHYDGPDPYLDKPRFKRNQDLFYELERTDKNHRAYHIFTKDLDS